MKQKLLFTSLLALMLVMTSLRGWGQTTFWTETFDNNTQYSVTLGDEGNDGSADYFQRTDGSNINKTYTGKIGTFFFAGQDIDDGGWTGSANPSELTWNDIDIAGYSSLQIKVYFASSATSKIDASDYLHIDYNIDGDGTSWNNLIWFENTGATYNTYFLQDTDFDGDGDGTILNGTFTQFTENISGTGSNLNIRLKVALDSGDEDFAIDNIEILGISGGNPTVAIPTFDPAAGTYYTSQNVTISCATEGSTIYYTTDGTDPDNTSTEYTVAIPVSSTTTIKAIAYATGYDPSTIATAVYTFPPITDVADIQTLRGSAQGATVYRITGECTYIAGGSFRNTKFFQDNSGYGIQIDDPSGVISTTYNVGDNVQNIIGTLGSFQGQLQFTPLVDPGSPVSTGNTVTPVVKELNELTSDNQSILVRVNGVEFESGDGTQTFGSGGYSTNITDPSIPDYTGLFRNVFGDSDISGSIIPYVVVDILGVIQENTNGLNLVARNLADFDIPQYSLVQGADNASNYGDSWAGNGGSGFGDWNLYRSGGTAADAGWFLGNSTVDNHGNINSSDTRAFALFGNNNQYANAERIITDWGTGAVFSIQLATQWRDGARGITLFNENGFGEDDDIWNFNVSNDGYGTTVWAYQADMVLTFEITQTTTGLSISVTGESAANSWTATETYTVDDGSTLGGFRLYTGGHNLGNDGQRNLYANNLTLETPASNVPTFSDLMVKSNVNLTGNLELRDLTVNAGKSLSVKPGSQVTVKGVLTNNSSKGTGGLILQSDASGTGSLLHNTADVDMTIQRYLTGDANTANAKYHTVSVPLTAGSNPQTGLFMGSYLYGFDFATQNYVSMGTSTTTPMNVDEGYLLYYPDANITYDFAGKANNGSFAAAVEYGVGDHYNLVPNPYPSAIDWDAASGWTKTNMNNAVYVYNTGSSSQGNIVWASYVGGSGTNGGSRYIPAGQAFFVQSNAAAPALSMTNEVRVHNSQDFYKNTTEETETLRLFAHSGDFTDEIVVRYLAESSPDFDGQYDALKFKNWNAAPNIYSLASDKTELSINSIPYSTETYVMEVGFERGEAGEAVIEVQGMESFGDWVTIFLEDLLTGARIDLRDQNTYSFIHEPENDPLRFTLRFMGVTGTDELSAENDFRIWSANSMLYLSHFADAPALMEVFDLQGRLLYSEKLNGMSSTSVGNLPLDQVLIVRLSSNESVTNQKVLIR